MDDNLEFAGKNPFDSAKSRPPLGVTSVFDFNVDCAGLAMDDFGRESLGIVDINHPEFRRDSLSFLYDPRKEDFGRESLGIINLNDDWKTKNLQSVPRITVTDLSGHAVSSVLNTAFISSLLSSEDSFFSFNSNSLGCEMPSTIFSTCSSVSSEFNEAFMGSGVFLKQLLNERYCNFTQSHLRVKSSPSELETGDRIDIKSSVTEQKLLLEEPKKLRKIKSDTDVFPQIPQNIPEKDDKFDDSVFLEANHLAHKVANKLDLDDGDILDRTQEPADFQIDFSEDESMKCDTETVFKTVDKMLPPVILSQSVDQNAKLSFKNEINASSNENKSNNSSRDPREIINSLSEFLNKVSPTEQQKAVGQNLLSSLAEIINGNSPFSNNLDDSGHSSSESDLMTSQNNECYEVLDLRKKSSSESSVSQSVSCEVCVPLDLSLKSRSANSEKGMSPKILPLKFTNTSQQRLIRGNSVGSNCSISSNENKSGTDLKNKFKPRKLEEKVNFNKGPLKAMLPVSNMARRKSIQVTPTRTGLQLPKSSQKKTSTPINKFNVKPVAQSTPEGHGSAISPFKSPNSSPKTTKQKLNYSGSSLLNKTTNLQKSFVRRHSVSDMKQAQGGGRLKRSNSMGESSGLKVTAEEVKLNVVKVAKRSLVSNKSVLQENRSKSIIKPPVGKKIGKENVH